MSNTLQKEDNLRIQWTEEAEDVVTLTTSGSTQSAALPVNRYLVVSTVDIWFKVGDNPTATVDTSNFMPGNTPFWVGITDSTHKIAARASAAAGTLIIMDPGAVK